jgi:hypothetical protein
MKTILSIPLIILILFSGVIFNFATHYCEGSVAATKISLTGELATCGMEQTSADNSLSIKFSNHCCDNIASVYSICNNYFPSSHNIEDPILKVVSVLNVPFNFLSKLTIVNNTLNTTIRPPGCYTPNSVTLPDLCIFRI